MSAAPRIDELLADVRKQLAPLRVEAVDQGGRFVVDLHGADGTVLWPEFASGPNETLALLAAEQRYLVEQVGRGAVVGATYAEKAQERLRPWVES